MSYTGCRHKLRKTVAAIFRCREFVVNANGASCLIEYRRGSCVPERWSFRPLWHISWRSGRKLRSKCKGTRLIITVESFSQAIDIGTQSEIIAGGVRVERSVSGRRTMGMASETEPSAAGMNKCEGHASAFYQLIPESAMDAFISS